MFAGALYNRDELDRRHGTSTSDSERVLRAFRAAPANFAAGLRGIFAIVIHEEASGDIVAVRDRIGIIPLFCARSADAIVFSPSLRQLSAHRAVSTQLNTVLLAEHLADFWTRAEETEFSNIRRVLPATLLRIAGGKESVERYWTLSDGPLERDPEELAEKFKSTLIAAVQRPMQMGKSGIFLSGGVDSISVAAMAREISNGTGLPPMTALSLFYRGSQANEEDMQTFVARELGMPLVSSALADAVQGRSAMLTMLEASQDWPVPLWNIYMPAFLQLAARGRDAGCEVILTGGGGDEWLGVGPFLAFDLLRSLRLRAYVRFIAHIRRSYTIPNRVLLRNLLWTFGVRQFVVGARNRLMPALGHDIDASRARRALPDWLAPDPTIRRRIIERLTQSKRAERLARNAAPSLYEYESRRSVSHPIVVSEMETKFAMGEAVGVHFFEPYWDADLIDLLYRTPPDLLSRGGVAKGLVHQLLKEVFPAFTASRQKKVAFGNFFMNKVRAESEEAWQATEGVPSLAGLGLVDGKKFAAMVEAKLGAKDSTGIWVIPHVLTMEAWVRARQKAGAVGAESAISRSPTRAA